MDSGAHGGGHDADGLRIRWQGLLVLRRKKSLLPQLFLQLLKGHIQIAHAVGLQGGAVELIRAVPREHAHPPHGDDLHAVLGLEAQPAGLGLKEDAANGAVLVLQRKIVVPAGGIELVVGYLAPDADILQLRDIVQDGFHHQVQL